jgi:hypothetical protein
MFSGFLTRNLKTPHAAQASTTFKRDTQQEEQSTVRINQTAQNIEET